MSSLEELWNDSLTKEWASEFSEANSAIDNKLVESSNSIEGWLEEFNNESVVSKGLERAFDVDTDFGDYDGSVNYLNQKYGKDASIVVDGAEVVELLGAGAFPFELTPDVTDLDEISELEMNVADNWFNEFQQYDFDSQQASNTIAEDAISFSDFENDIIEDWGHQLLDLPYLEEDVLSDLSESRPPTPPDGFEVVAFLDHSNFPAELTKVPEFLTSDAVKVYSAEEEQANQSHLQRWLDEFEDNQDSTKENPISGWMSEFSEIQDLLRQEIEYTEENEADLFSEIPSIGSSMAYEPLAYRMDSLPKESSGIFDNWTKDFLKAELTDNKSIADYGDDHISSELDAQWRSNLDNSPNQILMLDKKESIESTIKDLIKEIANEITTEEFLCGFDYHGSYGSVPDTYGVPIQTFDLEIAKPDFDERVTVSSEATKKNALDRLRQLRKHILGQ
ncbi:hypothetical protein K7432_015373 [Basidiobolus ranarum]|uniref:Uncharacterized protein n=1 Tax=Basidiobolus ranarum TaxID=34480 RepID=A0ABR2WG63_9FUNG